MIFKSIRFKIILWYMLVLALTLSLFSAAVYHHFSARLYSDLDELLISRAEGITDAIDMFWAREKVTPQDLNVTEAHEIDRVSFMKLAQQWVDRESGRPKLLNFVVRIFDVNGLSIAAMPEMETAPVLPARTRAEVLQGKSFIGDTAVETAAGETMLLRSWTHPVIKNGRLVYIVQVASPLTAIHSALIDLRLVLFVLLPLTISLTGIAGAFLARKALNPVDSMITTIRQITAQNLKLRIAIPDTRDEIKNLADTFNDMLGRLDKSLSAQQQLMQDISHEFKTPLTVLRGQLEVTLKKLRAPEEYERVLNSSLEEIDKLSSIISDILVLARFDSKEARISLEEFDLAGLARDTLGAIKVLADQKDITLALDGPEHGLVQADHTLMRRVLLNLLSNAVKFTPAGGQVRISLGQAAGGNVTLSVSDTGAGIAPRDLPRIFDRFYCADKSHSSHGLGLSIVKSIIEAHKGTIEVTSVPSRGTTFTISLPQPGA